MKIADDKVLRAVRQKAKKDLVCVVCGSTTWGVDERVFEVRAYSGGNLVIGGSGGILPLVAISCTNCGNTHLLNAIALGLMNKKGELVDPAGRQDESGD